MTKDDKQFLTSLIGQQDKKFTGLFKHLAKKIEGVEQGLDKKIEGVESSLGEQIRNNGILLEDLDDDVRAIGKNVSDLNNKMKKVTADIEEIKENTIDLPFIRQMLQRHESQLAKLR